MSVFSCACRDPCARCAQSFVLHLSGYIEASESEYEPISSQSPVLHHVTRDREREALVNSKRIYKCTFGGCEKS